MMKVMMKVMIKVMMKERMKVMMCVVMLVAVRMVVWLKDMLFKHFILKKYFSILQQFFKTVYFSGKQETR